MVSKLRQEIMDQLRMGNLPLRKGMFSSSLMRQKKLSSEVIETLRQENKTLTEENRVMRARLDRLEGKQFLEDLHLTTIKGLYQAVRVLARALPKTARAKKVLHEVRGFLTDAGIKAPPELRRSRKRLDRPIDLG